MDIVELLSYRFGFSGTAMQIEMKALISEIPDLRTRIEPYITEPKEYPYGRNVIYNNDEVEIIVVNIPANGRTLLHDHGNSVGCGVVLQGELINAIYEASEQEQIQKVNEHKIQANEIFNTPLGMIHQMLNMQSERVISLHVYSPPLKGLKVYGQPEQLGQPQPELQNVTM